MSAPTVAQMVARSNQGHHTSLTRIAADTAIVNSCHTDSAVRGYRTILATLVRWGAVETTRIVHADCKGRYRYEYRTDITDRGRDLLAALDAKRGATV